MPEPSILDERLAEIDRRLRMIQSGLESVPDAVAEPAGLPPGAGGVQPGAAGPSREAAGLQPGAAGSSAEAAEPAPQPPPTRLRPSAAGYGPSGIDAAALDPMALAAGLRELTAAQERLLALTRGLLAQPPLAHVELDAGPFPDTAALREFQHSLIDLPGVREVVVREYAGTARAVLEVQLGTPIS